MSSCDATREMLVLYAEGVLEPEEKSLVEEHLSGCADCSDEVAQIARIRGWLADSELFEPAQDLTWQLLPERLAGRARLQAGRKRSLFGLGVPKLALSTAALLMIACGLIWIQRYTAPAPPGVTPVRLAAGNEAFLDRVHTAYAREATAQYLSGCQDLLLDLISAEKTCAGDRYDVSLEVTRARQLLQEKSTLDAELRVPDVAHAKSLCDELEHFLVNLSLSQECETSDSLRAMERFIEKEQLLLRINLTQTGIS